jgi:hypothetical protein
VSVFARTGFINTAERRWATVRLLITGTSVWRDPGNSQKPLPSAEKNLV